MTGRIKHVFVTVVISLTVAGCVRDVILDAKDEPQTAPGDSTMPQYRRMSTVWM